MPTPTRFVPVTPTFRRRFIAGLALLLTCLSAPAAWAQLSGTYTIDSTLPTGGRNYATFAAAATALNTTGVSGPVLINVLNGPYTGQFSLGNIPGVSATDTVVIDGGASRQTLRYTGTLAQPAAVLLNGTDRVTLQNLTIDASAGPTYGIGVHLVAQANNNRVANCVVQAPATSTSTTAAGIVASGSLTSSTAVGDANNLRVENNTISGGYYGVVLNGTSITARANNTRVTGNTIRDFYLYGIYLTNTNQARLLANDIHRPTRTTLGTFYGLYLTGCAGLNIERNRLHDPFGAAPTATSFAYPIYMVNCDGTPGNENDLVNNLLYNFNSNSGVYGCYNSGSDYTRYYHNTLMLDNPGGGAGTAYGFYQFTQATGVEFRNNLVSLDRSGTRYALYFGTATSTIVSNNNDLYLGPNGGVTGRYLTTDFITLANWRTANSAAYDQNSVADAPQILAPATGVLQPTAVGLNGAGSPAVLLRVPADFAGTTRNNPPDIGAFEFTPAANDVDLLSIDAPTSPASPGLNAVTVTVRNTGAAPLTSLVLAYELNGGTPVGQTFNGFTLASGASRQFTFSTGLIPLSGSNTLTVTATLPNGSPDPNPGNNGQTITFQQPIPTNDDPCQAVPLGSAPVTSSNSGASTSIQNGISLPACSPAQAPKDVWFSFTPSGTSSTLTLTGNPAGMVRVFESPDCQNGPFVQVHCQTGGATNTSVGTVPLTGLVPGRRYYVAVSGYGSSDTQGQFTIGGTALATRTAQATALAVFPNPSATGQLTLRLAGTPATGTAELLNVLGQSVRQQQLAGSNEAQFSTKGLPAGLYTLQVRLGEQVLTRKVVLE